VPHDTNTSAESIEPLGIGGYARLIPAEAHRSPTIASSLERRFEDALDARPPRGIGRANRTSRADRWHAPGPALRRRATGLPSERYRTRDSGQRPSRVPARSTGTYRIPTMLSTRQFERPDAEPLEATIADWLAERL
jgi:hypothetical protein